MASVLAACPGAWLPKKKKKRNRRRRRRSFFLYDAAVHQCCTASPAGVSVRALSLKSCRTIHIRALCAIAQRWCGDDILLWQKATIPHITTATGAVAIGHPTAHTVLRGAWAGVVAGDLVPAKQSELHSSSRS